MSVIWQNYSIRLTGFLIVTVVLVNIALPARPLETQLISTSENSVILKTNSIYHHLFYNQTAGVVIDTLFYYRPPTSPTDYDDFLANYQGSGDTVINWFTLLAPGKVIKLMMQNSSTGYANWCLWVPAISGEKFQFPDDAGIIQLIPDSIQTQLCYELDMSQQRLDSLVWNTLDLGQGIRLDSSQLDFWVGYQLSSDGNPKIWQDGVYHYPDEEGSCRSWTTLHAQSPGKWYRNIEPKTDNWVAHMMQIEVRYEAIPPIISDLAEYSDTFAKSRRIYVRVVELEGEQFSVDLLFKNRKTAVESVITMTNQGEDWYYADLDYTTGDTIYYRVKAEDQTGQVQYSAEKSFACLATPGNVHLLVIDDSEYNSGIYYKSALSNLKKSYYYWNMEDHRGIDTTVIHYGRFQTLLILDGKNQIVPVKNAQDEDPYHIADFLATGGNLMLVDMDYLYRWNIIGSGSFGAGDFAYDYLGIEDYVSDPDDDYTVAGGSADTLMVSISGNPVSSAFSSESGFYGPMDYALGGSQCQNWADFIEPAANARGILKGQSSGSGMGVCYTDSIFRTITFGFPIEFTTETDEFVNLLGSCLQWLEENTTRIDRPSKIPAQKVTTDRVFSLGNNYPNPFNPVTKINFELYQSSWVELVVFDLRGTVVKTLIEQYLLPGQYTFGWDGKNQQGQEAAAGVYFYRLRTAAKIATRKMVLLR
jgi:hypothetical protein